MQVITDAKELEKHTYIKTRNPAVFPKKERLGLAQRMMNEASDLVADLMEANDLLLTDPEERELRYRAQRSALRNCRKLIHHIELAHEILSGFSDDAFAYWAKMAAGVKNQTAKWYKTDKERAAKLDAFDHWLRDDRGLVYGRYMDDFYIIHSDKLLLRQILKEIEAYIKPLGLRLNGKTQILPLKNGIDFLGFHTYLTQTGKVVRKVRAKSIDNMKRKIRKFRGLVDSGKMTLDSVVQSYASWTGHISHGNTYHMRQNMDAYFFSYFPELKPSPKGDTTHGPKTEQPRKQVEGQVRQPVRQPDRLDRGR